MGGQPLYPYSTPVHCLTGTVVEFPTNMQSAGAQFPEPMKSTITPILRKPTTDSDGESPILTHQTLYHDQTLDRPSVLEIMVGDDGGESSLSSSQHTLDTPEEEYTPNRVHFRPRVRITSGINRHRHSSFYSQSSPIPISPTYNIPNFSPESSLSSSPSSSISAPLRSPEDETKPGWGPLGRRVSLLTEGSRKRARLAAQNEERERQRQRAIDALLQANEQTPLLRPSLYRRRFSDSSLSSSECSVRDPEEQWRSMEIDRVFGTWPGRLINPHWWWWQVEPVVCCRCLDEPEDEQY